MADDDDRNRDDDAGNGDDDADRDADTGNGDDDADRDADTGDRELAAEAARYRRRLREREAELEKLRREQLEGTDRAVADAVAAERDRLTAEHRRELVELRVQVLAASRLRDPEDAARLLDVDALAEHADDPRSLERTVGQALDALLERKPYLAREADTDDEARDRGRRSFAGLATAGSRDRDRAGGSRGGDGDSDKWLRDAAKR